MRPAIGKVVRAALLSLKSAPRLHGVASLCVGDETTEPPAHCRLDPTTISFEDVALYQLFGLLHEILMRKSGDNERGEHQLFFGPFPVVRQERHSPRSRQVLARAPDRGSQGCRRHPQGLALTAAGKGAR